MTRSAPGPAVAEGGRLRYRPEIDGLRAIAVLAVVLYHAGGFGLSGGFVGVDVFFVISGFLIGGILWSELLATGRIRLGAFYLRRIRRLAPAFFAVAGASALAAWFLLLPFEFRSFGKELIAATVWLSNVLFYSEAGYFDIGSDSRVLLHTWSLSVEEQFYLCLPLGLIIAMRLRLGPRIIAGLLAALWLLSLAASLWIVPRDPVAAFFLFPYRAWEMLTGVLLAIWLSRSDGPPAPLAGILSWGGLALVLLSLVSVDSAGFPGWQVMLPVAGTAALLWGTAPRRGTAPQAVTRVLSWPAVAFVGMISYSLYLWHWPVLVLARYWRGESWSAAETAVALVVIFALAIASWRWIEQPVRHGRSIPAPTLLGGAALAAAVTLGIGAVAYRTDGLPARFGPTVQPHIAAAAGFLQDMSRCTRPGDGPLAGVETCAIGPDGPPEVLIWGDSHLRALMDGLSLAATEAGTPGLILWHAGCPPVFGIDKQESAATPDQDRACAADTARIRAAIPQMGSLQRVLLVGRWTYYADGRGVGTDAQNLIRLMPSAGDILAPAGQPDLLRAALSLTVDEIAAAGPRVYVLRQVPELPAYDSRAVARGLAHGHLSAAEAETLATVTQADLAARTAGAESALQAIAGRAVLIDPLPLLCDDICSAMQDGASLYFDNNHLNNTGAIALRGLFAPVLQGTAP